MTQRKRLVLDANILLRAVFGVRVRALLEDQDLFGSGVATWTTNNVELYLRDA